MTVYGIENHDNKEHHPAESMWDGLWHDATFIYIDDDDLSERAIESCVECLECGEHADAIQFFSIDVQDWVRDNDYHMDDMSYQAEMYEEDNPDIDDEDVGTAYIHIVHGYQSEELKKRDPEY